MGDVFVEGGENRKGKEKEKGKGEKGKNREREREKRKSCVLQLVDVPTIETCRTKK